MRGLPERTASATVQIEKVIEGIQTDTRSTVGAMSEVSAQVGGWWRWLATLATNLDRLVGRFRC